jgi:autotransporter-associated beta strand protein
MVVSNLTLSSVNILAPTNTFNIYNARGIRIIDSNLTAPNTTTNTLTLYNTEVTITNSAVSTNLVTLGGLATPPTNNMLVFYNSQAAITDTNMLGSGPVTLGGSTLRLTGPVSFSNNLTVISGSTLVFTGGNNTFGSMLDGPGPLSVILTNGSSLRFDQGANVWGVNGGFDAGASGTINNHAAGDITIFLGALSGGSGSTLRGSDQAGPGVDTHVIGGLNSNTTFAGTITDGTSGGTPHTVALTKIGSGTFTLTGANSYSGGTTVSNGTLLVNNIAGSGTGNGAVTVVSGATLGGTGAIGGPVTANGTLAPGNSAGTLAINNDLVVGGAAVLEYELGTNSDRTVVSGNLTLGGTLNITDAGGFTNGAYTLFTYGGTLTYSGVTVGTTPNTNFTYMIDLDTPGQVKLDVIPPPATVGIEAANLQDGLGSLASTSAVVVLVADTGNNGFVNPQSSFALSVGAAWGTDEKVVGLWDLRDSVSCSGNDGGALCAQTIVAYTNGIAPGQKLQLYWFPSLTLSSNTLGVTAYGKYTDTNNPPLDGSDAWEIPASESAVVLRFLTAYWGGANPDAAGLATNQTAQALTAFQAWQMQHFGCMACPQAASGADPDGDGQSNAAEFMVGTDPTNSASAFRIIEIAPRDEDMLLTWTTVGGKKYAVQTAAGGYTNDFIEFEPVFIAPGSGESLLSVIHLGGATNGPGRFYRVRLVP